MRQFLKPAIHYSRIQRIGDETIFSPNKIMFAKTGRMYYYTPFGVRRQFLREHIRQWEFHFFGEKLRVRRRDCYLDENSANRTACGGKPVRKTWQTPTIHNSLHVGFSSFRPCFVGVRQQCIAGLRNCRYSLLQRQDETLKYCLCILFNAQLH